MVATREGDDELTRILHHLRTAPPGIHYTSSAHARTHQRVVAHPVDRNGVLAKHIGRNDGHLVPEEGTALRRSLWKKTRGEAVHPCCVGRRDGVPQLGSTEVEVVDAVEVHVFSVPGKAGPPHAEVEVSRVDTGDTGAVVLCDRVQDGVQVINVPLAHVWVIESAWHIGSVERRVKG